MATLDSLPGDQRAVLQLVLQRGRTYDQIAALLSIDRAAVRQRALAAFDAIGPQTSVEAQQRALITDYLLGQLPAALSEDTRERLAESPRERAWARVVASELTALAAKPLPEIPVESTRRGTLPDGEPARRRRPLPRPAPEPAGVGSGALDATTATQDNTPGAGGSRQPRGGGVRPISRLGGALLLGGALIVIIVAIVVIAGGGSSKKHTTTTTAKAPTGTAAATTGTTGTTGTTATTTPKVVHMINLISPTTAKTAGLADVLKQGTADGIAIIAQNVPANTKHDAYAVWLYNSPTDNHILGFVNPGVGTSGRLSTAGPLPANASRYKALIVTLETQASPKAPGKIILEGAFSIT